MTTKKTRNVEVETALQNPCCTRSSEVERWAAVPKCLGSIPSVYFNLYLTAKIKLKKCIFNKKIIAKALVI